MGPSPVTGPIGQVSLELPVFIADGLATVTALKRRVHRFKLSLPVSICNTGPLATFENGRHFLDRLLRFFFTLTERKTHRTEQQRTNAAVEAMYAFLF